MMAEEWPIAAASADSASAPARGAGRDRLSTARIDFFLHPRERLTEQERALMTMMLHCLVSDIADEVRAALPNGFTPANDESNLALISALSSAGLLNRAMLVQLLLRRADEERIATAVRARGGRREARMLQGLVSHADGAVAAAAMALILARGRRRDRFGQCLLHFDDLPPAEAAALVHGVSAAIRRDFAAVQGASEADRQLAEASRQVIARHDPISGLEALTETLARLLLEEGDLSDELIAAGAMEGEMTFLARALAIRSGIGGETAMDELLSSDQERVMRLLRMAGVQRGIAASLIAGVGDLLGIIDAGGAIATFDQLSDGEVEDARSWLGTDAAYRRAAASLGTADGQRSV